MTETQEPTDSSSTDERTIAPRQSKNGWLSLRRPIPKWQSALFSLACILAILGVWQLLTLGDVAEERRVSPIVLPSPTETFAAFKPLWFPPGELTRNTGVTLRRVCFGFGLACLVGVPLGVAAGCFPRLEAFLSPVLIFGRNIPIAALIPLLLLAFGIDEGQKVMFIFVASIAFIVSDSMQAIRDVGQQYIDTAKTLGATRWQMIIKVLVPLAMPSILNSLRVLFGLAFGYIMLAEVIGSEGGIGKLISISQRMGDQKTIYLIILIIPLIAFAIDQFLFWVQRELFPHRYKSLGVFNEMVRSIIGAWDDLKCRIFNKNGGEEAVAKVES